MILSIYDLIIFKDVIMIFGYVSSITVQHNKHYKNIGHY